jgi:choice-of-anchor B domain-containing protein
MKQFFILIALLLTCTANSQVNFTLLGNLDYQALRNSDLSNLWVYTDEFGNEYALVGVNGEGGNTGGLSVVDITDPATPTEVAFISGPTSIWREIKTWGDHAYVTTEAQFGLLIVDLSPLPFSTTLPFTVFAGNGWDTSHSLFIDENGRLYVHGANRGNGGVIMYDLTIDPMAPVEVGEFDAWYCHDSFARGDTLYAAHIQNGFFSMVDVSDPAAPVLMGTQSTPNTFSHNVWLDDTGDHLFTTDEVSGAYVGSYNVSDPGDIQYQDKLQSDPGSGTIPHNTYWLNDFLVTSYYTYGVVIYDATYPYNLVETGHYDTSPMSGAGFNGAWGTCPFLPSGNVVVSDIETGLWILAPTYQHACWLEGTVRDAVTLAPIFGADVSVAAVSLQESTGFDGHYATGTVNAGTYDVTFSAVGYMPQTITGVVLQNGILTIQDADLVPLVPFDFTGQVVDSASGTGIADAFVSLVSNDTTYSTTADADGNFTFTGIFAGTFTLAAGQWGWITDCSFTGVIDAATPFMTVDLAKGWYDDFTFDFGWQAGATSPTGNWERSEPAGTTYNGDAANPDLDVDLDCTDRAYVTGNGGGGAGNDDVDDGFARLVSPVFDLSDMLDPYLDHHYWFFNDGGSGGPNDHLRIDLTNGIDTVTIQDLTNANATSSAWTLVSTQVQSVLPPTANMRLILTCTDETPGHLVEGGIDLFRIWEHSTVGIGTIDPMDWTLGPNPTDGAFTVHCAVVGPTMLIVRDARGRKVLQEEYTGGVRTFTHTPAPGVYSVEISRADGTRSVKQLTVVR